MKLGVRAHDIQAGITPSELKQKMDILGFDGLQLVFNKVFSKSIDEVDLLEIKKNFDKNIFLLGAYFNMVHPNLEEVNQGIINFKKHLDIADSINAPFVGSETGSLMGSPWGYMPMNHSDESFLKVVKIVLELVEYAKNMKVDVAIEGAYAHVIYSPKRMYQLLQAINHPKLKVILDLYNFLNIDNHEKHLDIFKEALDLYADKIVIFHLKDYIVLDGKLVQVGLGKGLMKYHEIIELIKEKRPDSYLIFEGVKSEDLASSLKFISNIKGGN